MEKGQEVKYPNDFINKIICGDCLEVMKGMPNECVDLVLIDPPYFLPAQHYQTRRKYQRNFGDLGVLEGFFKIVFEQFERIIKNNGSFYVFCDGQSYPLFYYYGYFFTKSVKPLIWDKTVSINGYGWRHQHELILWGEMPKAKPIPTGDGDILKYRAVKVDERLHPAEKPLNLISALINKSTKEEQVVLDCFNGSGTTALACKNLNLNFIGIEINPEYCKIAEDRLAQGVL